MNQHTLSIENISFSYPSHLVLKGLSLHLRQGEIATILGSSGSGKTTLFRLITGLLAHQSGRITIPGSRQAPSPSAAYMMQEDLLLPWRTALENVALGRELGAASDKRERLREAAALLEEVGLCETAAQRYPDALSGGMRQRVALARALIQRRPLLLLDEPFGALDVCHREQMYRLLQTTKEKHPMTVLLITHDFRDALFLSDRIFLLADGAITNEWSVTPEDKNDPQRTGQLQMEIREAMLQPA